jgi:hypothetical protein
MQVHAWIIARRRVIRDHPSRVMPDDPRCVALLRRGESLDGDPSGEAVSMRA